MKGTRSHVAALVVALIIAVVVLRAATSLGAGDEPRADTAWMAPPEREAMDLLGKNKPVTARRIAEEVLDANPDSIVAHYVLGRVLYEAEGSLSRAIYHLGHARELYEKRWAVSPRPPDAPWSFHRELLFAIASLAGEIEEYGYQLDMLDYHDALYRPALVGEHAWPLMKLGRVEDARAVAEKAAGMADPGQRSLGLNALCAIQRASHDRAAARTACAAAFENARRAEAGLPDIDPDHRSTIAVHAYNAALAARAAFEPHEAEKAALEGSRRFAFTPANPWRFLVGLYLDEGRGSAAADALRQMHRWRVRQPPQLRDQDRAETDAAVATVLLLAGRTEVAMRLVDRAIAFPDRRGLASTQAWQAQAANALLRRAIARAHDEILAEAASAQGDGPSLWRRRARGLAGFTDDERISGVLTDDDRLVDSFRIFGERGITPVPVWLLGDLIDVLGPGVTAVVLRMVRERDPDPRLEPYWQALEAEVHLVRGRTDAARRLAEQALAALPETEALLRARTAAVAAEAAGDDGDDAGERAFLQRAYQLDPSVLRRRGLALPARFRASGPDAAEVVEMLRRSPRFRDSASGFEVDVVGSADGARVCLRSPEGNELRCVPEDLAAAAAARAPKPPAAGEPAPALEPMTPERAVEDFHRLAFAMPLGLTGADMSSLDGSTTVAEQAVRDRIEDVLEEVSAP